MTTSKDIKDTQHHILPPLQTVNTRACRSSLSKGWKDEMRWQQHLRCNFSINPAFG